MKIPILIRFLALTVLLSQGAGLHAADWSQFRGEQRDGVWRETGIIDKFSSATLTPRWRAPIGPGYSGPTVAAGRVYAMDRQLQPEPGERILCYEEATGKPLWDYAYPCQYVKVAYPLGPRASVTIAQGRAFALGTMGHLHCLDAATGELLWKHDLLTEYRIRVPVWGISASPLVDGDRVIVNAGGADGACMIAFNTQSGKERWRALEDGASYSTPIIIEQNGKRVLVCWTADSVAGLDPETGAVYWRVPYAQKMAVASPVVDAGRVFVSSFYGGSMLLRLKQGEMGVDVAWQRKGVNERVTDSMHSTIATPIFEGDHIYGMDSYGELRCLAAATGDRVWEDLSAVPKNRWATIHFVRNGGRIWMFNELGELMIGELSPRGLKILSRAKMIEPTSDNVRDGVCWAHPAFANRRVYARNDRELICVSLGVEQDPASRDSVAAAPGAARAGAVQWRCWEHTLTASKNHPKPHAGVEVDATLTGPDGATLRVPAFWDGGKRYRFRAAFPRAGAWRWKTECNDPSDAGLHGQSGVVRVRAYGGDNPLYRHGDLRVSEDRRFLVHADGTPFLWMGDTGWNAAWKSNMAEWREYIVARARQRFSVVQVHATGTRGVGERTAQGLTPYLEDGSPDPAYWRTLEEKIAHANEQGLIVLLVGVGNNKDGGYAAAQVNPAFARFMAGRFAGHFVIFSPSMDQIYDPLNDRMGELLRPLTTHLVTQHPGTNLEAARKYHDAPYADFCGLQSGHQAGKLPRTYGAARAWTLEMWQRKPVKPVINIEAMYDGCGGDDAPGWRERDARKLGWISWLSGSMGYTYGAGDIAPKVPRGSGGVWRFNADPGDYDHWRKALAWPSAGQMTILRDFFADIAWWRLEPAHELVQNQAGDETRKMVAARSRAGDLLVAYLPDNQQIVLNLQGLPGPMAGHWLDPIGGKIHALDAPVMPAAAVTLKRPAGCEDAVLLLKKQPAREGSFKMSRSHPAGAQVTGPRERSRASR